MSTADADPVRVIIVDDEPLIRSGFRYVLGVDPGIEIVGEASDGAEAVELVRLRRPNVVLMDVRMPRMGGAEATLEIVAHTPATRVLAMTSFDAEDQLVRMLAAGATGYLLKDEAPDRILDAVKRTATGEAVVSGRSTAQLIRRAVQSEGGLQRETAVERVAVLTERERQVAIHVARGATNQEIAQALHISAATVKTHLEQVLAKLAVRNRVQVSIVLERAGLGPADV